MLITKHMLFVGFSLRDEAFNQVAAAVRRALGPDGSETAETADEIADGRGGSARVFGTALTVSDRPVLSELWPDLDCVAGEPRPHLDLPPSRTHGAASLWRDCTVSAGVAKSEVARAERSRKIEIFLDLISLERTSTAEHVLDPKFAATSSLADLELRHCLVQLVHALRASPESRRAPAFALVREMLLRLGCSPHELESELESQLGIGEAAAATTTLGPMAAASDELEAATLGPDGGRNESEGGLDDLLDLSDYDRPRTR